MKKSALMKNVDVKKVEGSGKKLVNRRKKAIWCLWIGVRKCVVPSTWKPTNTITTALVLFGIFISCDSPLPNWSIFLYFFPSTFPVREILRFHISFCIEILFALSLSINMSVASESFSLCIPNRNGFESGCVWVHGKNLSEIQAKWKKRTEVSGKKRRKKYFGEKSDIQRRKKKKKKTFTKTKTIAEHILYITFLYVVYYLKRMTAQTSSVDGFSRLLLFSTSSFAVLLIFISFSEFMSYNRIYSIDKLRIATTPKWMWQENFCTMRYKYRFCIESIANRVPTFGFCLSFPCKLRLVPIFGRFTRFFLLLIAVFFLL